MPDDSAGARLRQLLHRKDLAAARQRAALARLAQVRPVEMTAIAYLAQAGELTPSQLGARIQVSSGGVTMLVARLERAGLVERAPHPGDRRSSLVRLRPDAVGPIAELLGPLVEDLDEIASRMSEDERRCVERYLAAVAEASERHAERLSEALQARERRRRSRPLPVLWS